MRTSGLVDVFTFADTDGSRVHTSRIMMVFFAPIGADGNQPGASSPSSASPGYGMSKDECPDKGTGTLSWKDRAFSQQDSVALIRAKHVA